METKQTYHWLSLGCEITEELPIEGNKGMFSGDENVLHVTLVGEHTISMCVKFY